MKKKYWENAYLFWYDYFFSYNQNAQSLLLAYDMVSKKDSLSTISYKMRDLKRKYSEDYTAVKNEYLDAMGISEISVVTRVNDIADNAYHDSDKLKALDMLMKYMNSTADGSALNAMNAIQVSFQSPASRAIDEEVENPSYYVEYGEDCDG